MKLVMNGEEGYCTMVVDGGLERVLQLSTSTSDSQPTRLQDQLERESNTFCSCAM